MPGNKSLASGCVHGLAAAALLVASTAAHAILIGTEITVQTFHVQTGGTTFVDLASSPLAGTPPLDAVGNAQIFFEGFVTAPSDFTSITVSGPGFASAQALGAPVFDNGIWRAQYFDRGFADVAAVNAKYPLGSTYTFEATASNPALNQTATKTYTDNHLPTTSPGGPVVIPLLAAASYAGLQALDAASSIMLSFNAPFFGDGETAVEFAIFDPSTFQALWEMLLPNTTSSLLLPAATLAPDTEYIYALGYRNSLRSGLEFENFTLGEFRTAASVPEPAAILLLGLGIAGLGVTRRRHSSRHDPVAGTARS